MAEKETSMKLLVNLECEKCCKKVKKLLAKYPREIREQKFDKKKNTVTISVVCCSPEKVRDKLCCKGGGCIKSIEILEPPKTPPNTTPKPDPTPPVNVNTLVHINVNQLALPQTQAPGRICCGQCHRGRAGGPCVNGYTGRWFATVGIMEGLFAIVMVGGDPFIVRAVAISISLRNTGQGVQYNDHAHSPHSHHV